MSSHHEILERYFEGINREGYEDVAALFGAEGVLVAPGVEPRVGATEIAAYFAAALAPYPEHHEAPTRIIDSGHTATVEIAFNGVLANGARLGFDAVDVFDFDERGGIGRVTSWYDSFSVRRRLAQARGDGAAGARAPGTLMVAMVSPLKGAEAEFNAWCAEHMREVRGVPRISSAQRYRFSRRQAPGVAEPEHEYLAVYDIDGDHDQALAEIVRRRAEGEWSPRRGLDEQTIRMWFFEPISDGGEE